jgi:ribosome maturation factor RimP
VAFIDWPTLEEIAKSVADSRNAYLVGVAGRKEGPRRIIQVFVDTDEGITIAQCAEVSRDLGAALDAKNVVQEPYELEVSSPGIERPLKLLRQYKKNVGRKYKVEFWQENERRTMSGTLAAIEGERLTFTTEKKDIVTLDFSKIIESIEELPW